MNIIDKKTYSFLNGKSFSNAYYFPLTNKKQKIQSRERILFDIVAGKRIIHFGCADHIELIDDKIKNNSWLHNNLCAKTEKTVGIDINKEAIDYLKTKHEINEIYHFNIYEDILPQEIKDEKFDYLILGEILEHVDNPVEFLALLNLKFSEIVSKIIITVPNSLSFLNIKMAYKNVEYINSDHRYWFSPYTLSKVCSKAKITPEHFTFYVAERYSMLTRFFLKKFNLLQDGIVWVGKFNKI